MLTVREADQIILSCKKDYGFVSIPLTQASGRTLAEDIIADRDLPPYNRVAMDGIAIRHLDFERGRRQFHIAGVVGAGESPVAPLTDNTCFEIMTGAAIPAGADTIIPYEQLQIEQGYAVINRETVKKGQHVHLQGADKKQGAVLIPAGQQLGPVEISVAASVGKDRLLVKNLPRVAIFSSGNELVELTATPLPYQIRRSNNYTIHAALQRFGIEATMLHLPDDLEITKQAINQACASFDVLILSGGISMGKFDYLPRALKESGVEQRFHKVRQKPGKPFLFGTFGEKGVVFALPGNPVSTFLCLQRYVLPWLETSLGFPENQPVWAVLDTAVQFEPALQYFLQVQLKQDEKAVLHATPLKSNGSGDYSSLLDAHGFMELPEELTAFQPGMVFPVWTFR